MNNSSSYMSKSGGIGYDRHTDPNLAISSDDDKSHMNCKILIYHQLILIQNKLLAVETFYLILEYSSLTLILFIEF